MSGRIILVEGNICVGKSTLAKSFEKKFNAKVFIEPALDNPYLERYYANPKKFGLVMQLYLLRERYKVYIEALKICEKGETVVLDRSIFSDFVFAKKNYDDGNITKEGFDFYLMVRKQLLKSLPFPHCVVYLECSPEKCLDRINNLRGRECESVIPVSYLQGLDDCYEDLLTQMKPKCPILRVDWSNFGDVRVLSEEVEVLLKSEELKEISEDLKSLLYNEKELSMREKKIKDFLCQCD